MALALLSATASSAPAPDACGKDRPFYLGAGLHLGQGKGTAAQARQMLSDTGLNAFRGEIYWDRLEASKGRLAIPPKLNELESLITQKGAGRFFPLIALDYGNPFYDQADLPRSDEAVQGFANYAGFVARTYGDAIPLYEVWNEWNSGMGSKVRPRKKGSPEDYMRLIKATAPEIRKASPKALIIAGATSRIDMKWSRRFAELGGMDLVDGFSIHPYNYNERPYRTPENAVSRLEKLQASMVEASGKPVVPFYITEIGVPTSTAQDGQPEDEVGNYAMRFMLLARSLPYVCGVWWYELYDGGPKDDHAEHRFGLHRQNGDPKPAAQAVASLAALLRNGRDFKSRQQGNLFTVTWTAEDGTPHVAQWTNTGSKQLDAAESKNLEQVKGWEAPASAAQPSTPALAGRAAALSSTANGGATVIQQTPLVFRQRGGAAGKKQ